MSSFSIQDYFIENNILLENIMFVTTGGYVRFPMVSRHHGFITFLKREVLGILTFHRQHLVIKNFSDRLHQPLLYVIINKIRSNTNTNRLLGQLYKGYDEEFNFLILHTEVRWLYMGLF